jgi:hypothetical protein
MKHPYDVPTTTKTSFQQTNEINTDAPGTNNDVSKYRTLLLEQTRMKNPNEVPENRSIFQHDLKILWFWVLQSCECLLF